MRRKIISHRTYFFSSWFRDHFEKTSSSLLSSCNARREEQQQVQQYNECQNGDMHFLRLSIKFQLNNIPIPWLPQYSQRMNLDCDPKSHHTQEECGMILIQKNTTSKATRDEFILAVKAFSNFDFVRSIQSRKSNRAQIDRIQRSE